MSDFRRCPVCREHGWFGAANFAEHRCAPTWECRPEWYSDPDDWHTVHAIDSETAAEKYAEHYDCEGGDYSIVFGKTRDDVIIYVRKPGDDAFERWSIEAEAVPTYRATKVDEPPTLAVLPRNATKREREGT